LRLRRGLPLRARRPRQARHARRRVGGRTAARPAVLRRRRRLGARLRLPQHRRRDAVRQHRRRPLADGGLDRGAHARHRFDRPRRLRRCRLCRGRSRPHLRRPPAHRRRRGPALPHRAGADPARRRRPARPPPRRSERRLLCRTGAGFLMRALLLLLLVLFAGPALAQQETPEEERSMLLAFIEDRLSAPNRQIRLQGIEGVLSSNARIGSITVADSDGIWLRITDASIVWSRSALIFSQRLQIDRLAAARIEVLRRPLADESLPSPESSSFQLPELPVAVNLDELDVPSVSFGPDVFGLESELAITGRVRLEDGSLDTALDINRLDGPGGRFALAATYANATEQLDLDLQLSEPENGVIANLLNIEGRPPVDLAVQGSGPLSGLDVALTLDAGGERVLTGNTALRRESEGLRYDARFSGPIARLVPAQFRDFFGDETALTASGLVRDAGGVVLDALDLDSAALDLAAKAETGADGFLRRLNLEATLDNGSDERVVLPVPGGDTTVQRAALTLSFGETADGEWSGLLTADELATADFGAEALRLTLGGVAAD